MGIFDGANDPSIPVGYNRTYFKPGAYRVRIDSLKAKDAKETFKGRPVFIAEFIIVATDTDMHPGAVIGWVQRIDPATARSAFASLKEFFAAALNDPQLESIPNLEEHLEMATSEANPYRGVELDLVCFEKPPAKGKTDPFTVHNWKPRGSLKQFDEVA